MAGAGVVTTTITTPTTRTLSVFVGGIDLTSDVKWDTLVVTDSGASAKGTSNFTVERSPSEIAEVTDQALVRVVDHSASGGEAFRGYVRSRRPSEDPQYPRLEIIADDLTSLLDDAIIDVEYRSPESMQARLGYFWGKYAGAHLSGDLSYVLSIGSTLPAQRFEVVSLRNAIEMTLAQASSSADYYVDMLGKLHVFTSETNNAPFNVDADAPGGGEIAPEQLNLEYDSNAYANRVLVKGASPTATLYVQDEAAIAAANGLVRTAVLQEPSVTTAAMARSLGQMYLGRVKAAKPRGSFVTSSPDDGWRGGQNVLVTSNAHSLTNQSYKIARVTTRVLVPGANMKRQYTVEFGGARAGAGLDGQVPLIAGSASGVYMLDQLGNSIISNAAAASQGMFGPAGTRYIVSGIYNSDFFGPPPGPDAPIDDTTNPLPYWSFVNESGSAVTAISTLDSGQASGRKLRFTMNAGAAGDRSYIEQLVPINGSRSRSYAYQASVAVLTESVVNNIEVWTGFAYLDVSGQVISTPVATGTTTSAYGASTLNDATFGGVSAANTPPTNAYYIRVRVGLNRGAAANGDSVSVSIGEARMVSGAKSLFADLFAPGSYGAGAIGQSGGRVLLDADLGGTYQTELRLDARGTVFGTEPTIDMSSAAGQRVVVTPQGALARRTTVQSITASTWTAIAFNASEDFDPFGFHDTGVNPSRFTVPTGWDGTYLLVGHAGFGNIGASVNLCGWGVNGANPVASEYTGFTNIGAVANTQPIATSIMELAAGDYVELFVWQNTAGAQNTQANAYGSIMYLGERV